MFDLQNDKAKHSYYIAKREKWNTHLRSCIGNGTFELSSGTASTSRTTGQWGRDKVQELCSKDTARERYLKYCKLD
jgi:hypothetical protein